MDVNGMMMMKLKHLLLSLIADPLGWMVTGKPGNHIFSHPMGVNII